jgi:uncharacterized repeat protein (TIGR03803 family)
LRLLADDVLEAKSTSLSVQRLRRSTDRSLNADVEARMTKRSSSSLSHVRRPRRCGVVIAAVIATFALLGAARAARGQALDIVHGFAPSTDPAFPEAALIQVSDGTFYGTSSGGGAYGLGTVFRVTADGPVTVLHSFSGTVDNFAQTGTGPFRWPRSSGEMTETSTGRRTEATTGLPSSG